MEKIERLYYAYFPEKLLGEVLTKRWSDNFIPILAAILVIGFFFLRDPGFFSVGSVVETSRQLSEFAIVVVAMGIVLLAGGLDLSIGSVFALANIVALICMNLLEWSVGAAFLATLGIGAVCGARRPEVDHLARPMARCRRSAAHSAESSPRHPPLHGRGAFAV